MSDNAVRSNGENLTKLLGRRAAPDTRDYPLRAALAAVGVPAPVPPIHQSWRTGPILNQGLVECPQALTTHPFCREQGFCVGAGSKGFLMSDPIRTMKGPSLLDIYHIAQTLDEWDGISYAGTSVRAGMKTLQRLGHIQTYSSPRTPLELQLWLGYHGSVCIGVDWSEAMFYPDKKGFITDDKNYIGGHCLEVNMMDLSAKNPDDWFYGGPNSWGLGWGYKGRWRMKAPLLHKLLFEQGGECFAATEVRLAKV